MADHPQDLPPDTNAGGLNAEALFALGIEGQRTPSRRVWEPPTVEGLQRVLPQYEISEMVGRGGMGAVYKGVQRSLDRVVAIKVLPAGIEDDAVHYIKRFKMEAKSMARLSHPGIVAVFDAGETAEVAGGGNGEDGGRASRGLLYFVMEFVEGTDVQKMIAQGPIPPAHALAITAHVCDALGFAHESGIVHRDIKPANIMVDTRGHVKVADFGLAKVTTQDSGGFTRSGLAMGTPDYIAPEAIVSTANVDGRADLYAVGVMLYTMLTGSIPRGRFALPSGVVKKLDPRFDAIVDKAIQTDREQRYPSAAAMRADLDCILSGPIPVAVPVVAKRSKAPLLIAAAAIMLIAIGWFVWKPRHAGAPASFAAQTVQTPAPETGAIKLWDAPESIPKLAGIRWENGALRIDGTAARYSTTISRDAILRAEVRMNPGRDTRQIGLRHRLGETAGAGNYRLQVSPDAGTIILDSVHPDKTTELHRWRLPRPYGPDEWLRVELRAIGDELTVSADDELLGSVHDASLPKPGGVQLFAIAGGYFRNIVYVPLDKPGPASTAADDRIAALAANPANWVDRLNTRKWDAPWVLEKGVLTTTNKDQALSTNLTSMRDGAIRVHARATSRTGIQLQLILRSGPVFGKQNATGLYQFQTNLNGLACALFYYEKLNGVQQPSETLWKSVPLPTALAGQTEMDWELRAVGDELSAWANGQFVASTHDKRVLSGGASITSDVNLEITKVETINFANVSPSPSLPTSADAALRVASGELSRSARLPISPSSTFATATKDAPFVNSLGMKFVPVPITGGPTDGQRVLFSVWETRVQDYEVFVQQAKYEWNKPGFLSDANHPAVNTNWDDAQAFCAWLTEREHKSEKLGAGEHYRLPSDHEWSCAVGIGERENAAKLPSERSRDVASVFPWGTAWPPPPGAGNYSGEEVVGNVLPPQQGAMTGYRDDFPRSAPVGSFAANESGLFDLGGNASEWCEDWFDGEQQRRTIRGSSFVGVARVGVLSAGRSAEAPATRFYFYGFRCVVSATAAGAGKAP